MSLVLFLNLDALPSSCLYHDVQHKIANRDVFPALFAGFIGSGMQK